jgi:hypothetical protein
MKEGLEFTDDQISKIKQNDIKYMKKSENTCEFVFPFDVTRKIKLFIGPDNKNKRDIEFETYQRIYDKVKELNNDKGSGTGARTGDESGDELRAGAGTEDESIITTNKDPIFSPLFVVLN